MKTNIYGLMGRDRLDALVEKAINFIVDTQEENDYICELNGEWCKEHCIDSLRKECVLHYLENVYEKKEGV